MVAQAAPATPHLKPRHEPDVQHRVHGRADQQEDQRHKAVPKPPQDAREDVVKGEPDDADEDDPQVVCRHVHNLRRGVQQLQKRPGEQHAAHRHQDADQQGQHHRVADRLGEELTVPGTEVLGNHNPGAGRDADEEDQQQVVDRPARPDGREGVVPDVMPDDNRVDGRIKLLGDVADQQRDGELDDGAGRAADGHIPRGKKLRDFVLCHFVSPAFLCLSI